MNGQKFQVFVLSVLVVFFSAAAWSNDVLYPHQKHFHSQQQIFMTISQYWDMQNLNETYINNPTTDSEAAFVAALENHEQLSSEMGDKVIFELKCKNRELIELLSRIYRSLQLNARQSLYLILAHIRFASLHEPDKTITEKEFREYFPGYGYSEPGYKYRKGLEIDREFKGYQWQQEEQTVSVTWNIQLTISIDILDILKGLLTSGAIKDLKVSEPFETEVSGEPMICVNVSFIRVKALTTKTNRKFELNKVWFELLRAKVYSSDSWQIVGKTYEILHEPTGDEVVTGIQEAGELSGF